MHKQMAHHEEPERYNKFFNPNMCHVCKMRDHGDFITCDQCYMITYCKTEHQQKDYPHHIQICMAMQTLLKSHPHLWVTVQLSLEGWNQSRKEFQVNIHPCKKCWSVNYCLDHAEAFTKNHHTKCKDLLLHLTLYLELRCISVPIIKFCAFPNVCRRVDNMHTFCEQYVRRGYYTIKGYTWITADYFYSDYLSAPLTLYYGMKNVNLLKSKNKQNHYVVHIIAAGLVDREYLPYWELFLHGLPNVKDLKIVLIGSELRAECEDIAVCAKCSTTYRRKLSFECSNMSYHSYMDSNSYQRPNVVVGLQADLNEWDALSTLLVKIRNVKCPLLLTAKSKLMSQRNVNLIKAFLDTTVKFVYHGENKFCSGKPYRDLETDGASYRNKYLVIYPNLLQKTKSNYNNRRNNSS
ncbi:uncharacterized protein LOC116847557 isoform X2 [Odontomachus brunneus]|uniref:uncharacterized protein LOC116847557 isoform X2 n=1 Tax=Odontomachus brunneus TaxID=486640 RepID=UPI0013F2306E|nr:uncharacterized protein LOC116847557 isoform X2 [Odontomachus brunneus]